ncbi:hypothetical protein BV25DRAFT_1592321 [Artomyces pyxidatus]|uniref:Uncharacterized protein n=1 Tax=Artomyces pyxidatus TaxID=48021 RepID=A0ACB8TAC9_9AGAM|nr:hypothetical protein BV25DRAFT_1592321 [Artomyces pyxidatus]
MADASEVVDSKPPACIWPLSAARSTGIENYPLLCAMLAAGGTIDEISNADDYSAVERYISGQGRADKTGRTRFGLIFWLYPTGMRGPYHETDEGKIEQHGTLITVEPGILVEEAVVKVEAALREDGIAHEHVAAAA